MYQFLDQAGGILYVGKAKDLKARVSSYFTPGASLGEKTATLVSQVKKIKITSVESELEALLLEAFLIKKYTPKYNIRLTDGKSYPLIQITLKDRYPSLLFARRIEDPESVYFGPFPSSGSVKSVLKTIRRIFPYQSVRNHPKRICLYHHLNLCPCPPVYDTPELRQLYRQQIRRIVAILEGKSQKIIKDLAKERDLLTKSENFEKAQEVQRQLQALMYVTQPFRQGFEYDTNPNLRSDTRSEEVLVLQKVLQTHGMQVSLPERIECYDISNIQGTNAVGSMVVFIEGEKESALYRKYKIKRENTPNDFAMMEEVLTRRLKHTEWEYPDLLVVDGGKGQITSALKALASHKLQIPLIGLAKREETIIIPKGISEDHFREISLSKNSPALQLLMRIRDEAHRFAITYHRKLRSKKMTRSITSS